jgi:hypothetical protein
MEVVWWIQARDHRDVPGGFGLIQACFHAFFTCPVYMLCGSADASRSRTAAISIHRSPTMAGSPARPRKAAHRASPTCLDGGRARVKGLEDELPASISAFLWWTLMEARQVRARKVCVFVSLFPRHPRRVAYSITTAQPLLILLSPILSSSPDLQPPSHPTLHLSGTRCTHHSHVRHPATCLC